MITVLECDTKSCSNCGHITNCQPVRDNIDEVMQSKMEHDLEDFLEFQEDREIF